MRRSLLSELNRRNVWRPAALYAACAWLVVQVATQVFPFFEIPSWVVRWIVVAAVLGFPFWILFAWFYELTPEGLKRESEIDPARSRTHSAGKALDRWIIGILAVAVVLLLTNTFISQEGAGASGASDPDAPPPHSIAVLPFVNLSSDQEQGYFADGISEDLLDLLAKVPAFRVAARTSSFSFKGRDFDIPEIAKRLHVAHVLEGSVRKSGNEVRITAQLVNAADGYQVWSQTWNRKLDDIFSIQSEIAAEVARQLEVKLLDAAPTARETDTRGYALYLQARELGRQLTAEALAHSDSLYRTVLELDPRYAPGWAELARNLINEVSIGAVPVEEGQRRAREALNRALAIEPDYAPAHARLGRLALDQGDVAGAAQQLEHALARDRSDLTVLGTSAQLLKSLGRLQESIAILEAIVARDPVNPTGFYSLGNTYRSAGRFEDAIAQYRTALSLRPGYGAAHFQLGVALLLQGNAPAALAEMQQESSEAWGMIGLPMVYHALGRNADSDTALAKLIETFSKDAAYNIAYVCAFRGEADRAYEWLDRAVENGDPGLSEIPVDNLFGRIQSDARWLPFLRRLGMAPEQLVKIPFRVRLPESTEPTRVTAATDH